jgi:hypothetical protein
MTGFSDAPFVAGSLVGLRSFIVDRNRLSAVTLPWIFDTQTMTAQCLAGVYLDGDDGGLDHRAGDARCTCGFHAYYDGTNDFAKANSTGWRTVSGIFQGFGLTMSGSRGFRSEKGRIIALIRPAGRTAYNFDNVALHYPGLPIYESLAAALVDHPLRSPDGVVSIPNPDDPTEHEPREDNPVYSQATSYRAAYASAYQTISYATSALPAPHMHYAPITPQEKKDRAERSAWARMVSRLKNIGGIQWRQRDL